MPDHSPVVLWFWQGVADLSPQQIADCLQCLSCSEREFLDAISAKRRRLEYITGHYLLGQMLQSLVPDWVEDLTVEHQRGRAPCLIGPNAQRIHFSLSHSGSAVCCAVALGCQLGLDIELPRRRKYVEIAEACFAPVEIEQLTALPVDEREAEFYRLWTLKESLLKAKGGHLNDESLAVTFLPVINIPSNPWHCYSFRIPPFSFALTLSRALSETLHVHMYCPGRSSYDALSPDVQHLVPKPKLSPS